jgi:predicted transglutaminase-like cysteine proteinase
MSLTNWIRSWFGAHYSEHLKLTKKLHRLPEIYWLRYKQFKNSISNSYQYNNKYPVNDIPTFNTIKNDLNTVLSDINRKFIYVEDGKIDNWELPILDKDGFYRDDCDGYTALLKSELLKKGFHNNWISIATCFYTPGDIDSYHMVLVIHTKEGDYVCENNHKNYWIWYEYGFEWDFIEKDNGLVKIENN